MIKIQPIRTSDVQHYKFMEELLISAFPPEEYRKLEDLREYTDHKGFFSNNIIFEEDTPIGFITYWEFKDFYYVEHFAINPALRNGGHGKKTLECLCNHLVDGPIVLEVEEPVEEIAKRRIAFYQRQGFVLWKQKYQQPPYKLGDPFLPMHLMVYGALDCNKDFVKVRNTIYKEVYEIKEDFLPKY